MLKVKRKKIKNTQNMETTVFILCKTLILFWEHWKLSQRCHIVEFTSFQADSELFCKENHELS